MASTKASVVSTFRSAGGKGLVGAGAPAFLLAGEDAFVDVLGFDGGPGVGAGSGHGFRYEDHFPGAGFAVFGRDAGYVEAADGEGQAVGGPDAGGAVHVLEGLAAADGSGWRLGGFADGCGGVGTGC